MKTLREKLVSKASEQTEMTGLFGLLPDDALSIIRTWLADEGLAIVPTEATDAMVIAGEGRSDAYTKYVYARMIAAAPDALGEKP